MWATTSHRHVPISGVSLRLDKPARRPSKMVASGCLFRHSRGDVEKMEVYVAGLEKTAAEIKSMLPDWNLRIYLDASIYGQDAVVARIYKMHEAHDHVEIFAATCDLAECGTPGSTFLPSLWRFLAGLDASVDAFLCIDADATLNPLVAHVASAEWIPGPSKYVFVALSGYNPPWCAMNAFQNATFGDANDCPISNGWGGKKVEGDDTTILPSDLWTSLVKAIQDPDLKAYALLRRKVADALMSAMKRDPEYLQLRLRASKSPTNAPQFLEDVMRLTHRSLDTLQGSDLEELKDLFKRRPDMLRFHALRENRLFWDAMPLSVSSSMPSSGWAVQQNKSIKCAEDADDILDSIASRWDYGVDEWLLHKILDEARRQKSVLVLETPKPAACGIEFHPQIKLSKQSDLPYPIAAIKAIANDRWQDQNTIEMAARFLLIAFAARASNENPGIWASWVAAYLQRAFAPFEGTFRSAGVDQAMFAAAFEQSVGEDAAAWLQLWKRFAFVLDKQVLVQALGGPDVAAVDKGVVSCKNEVALRRLLRLLCDAAFLNMSMYLSLGSAHVPGLYWY